MLSRDDPVTSLDAFLRFVHSLGPAYVYIWFVRVGDKLYALYVGRGCTLPLKDGEGHVLCVVCVFSVICAW